MSVLYKSLLIGFEVANELYIALASGLVGMIILVKHGLETNQTVKTMSVLALTSASLAYVFRNSHKLKPSKKNVVVITGCDSGIGFSLARFADDCGFTVIAGFLSLDSEGSKEIRKISGGAIIQIQLDITDSTSISNAVYVVQHYFNMNPGHSLHALINNAGVMVFGEFEWLTERLIEYQLNVNLLGTFKCTKAFCPLLRQHKGRIITVTSHCALECLPGLSVYGATKAALASWSDGIRVELEKYGVSVTTLIPGSFYAQSNLMSNQLSYVKEMHDAFTKEQHLFYSDYFKRYNVHLSQISTPRKVPVKIEDKQFYTEVSNSLLDTHPKVVYKHEPWRYKVYHFFFKISPVFLRDYLILNFMQMPEYQPLQPSYPNELDSIDL